VWRAVHQVTDAIAELLFPRYVRWPATLEENQQIELEFYQLSMMPGVCGAIDGNLIKIKPPKAIENQFVDREHNHSLNLTAVCDAKLR
jgi:hypothetical protein